MQPLQRPRSLSQVQGRGFYLVSELSYSLDATLASYGSSCAFRIKDYSLFSFLEGKDASIRE